MTIGDWILIALAALVAVPWVVLSVEASLAVLPIRSLTTDPNVRPRCGVLIPAHNEESGIADTVQIVRSQLHSDDFLFVIADNCNDDTAEIARGAGATVLERHDLVNRGKGFALDYGLSQLPPDIPVVLVVDADCVLGENAINRLVETAHQKQRPVQGIYLIGDGREDDPKRQLSAFAVLLKNKIRPLGLHRLGLPCLLTGTGLAIPRVALNKVHLGSGNIVEDMRLGVDLALAGYPPILNPDVHLHGASAPNRASAIKQRTRWEHGHVSTLCYGTPRLILNGLFRLRPSLIGLGLELGVPPLSMLVLLAVGLSSICLVWWQLGFSPVPFFILMGVALLAAISGFAAWIKYGRGTIPLKTLVLLPGYVAWKIPIYLKLIVARQQKWVRTERATEDSGIKA